MHQCDEGSQHNSKKCYYIHDGITPHPLKNINIFNNVPRNSYLRVHKNPCICFQPKTSGNLEFHANGNHKFLISYYITKNTITPHHDNISMQLHSIHFNDSASYPILQKMPLVIVAFYYSDCTLIHR